SCFAKEAALVLAANGIRAYLFKELRPTPELSYAVRHLHAIAGIVITASHNPKEYNGYKVYWEDGGQVPPKRAEEILQRIQSRHEWVIYPLKEEEALSKGLLQYIGEEVDQAYLKDVKSLALYPDLIREKGDKLSIVYTPLHGAANMLVYRALQELGFSSLFTVPEQEEPDSEFSTVPYPNPEDISTFELARKYGMKRDAQLLIGTDPDGDRLGALCRTPEGDYKPLSGNQVGIIMLYYLLSQKKKLGILPKDAVVIKTVASTDLADVIVKDFGVAVENVLTGFKFIAEKEKEMEEEGTGDFQFGFEESCGYLAGHFVRDKDSIIGSLLLAEATLYYQEIEGKDLFQVLEEIYGKYGYFGDDLVSITLEGKEGREQMEKIMANLREQEVTSLGGMPVSHVDDYLIQKGKNIIGNKKEYSLTLPPSNVLRYSFVGGGFVMARPSGTEPKIKFYFNLKVSNPQGFPGLLSRVKSDLREYIKLPEYVKI
ncbi:MAG: phospho-sugar mutase, partial [Desulfitobacterium sp.]|nr:phospho-sugar mutase [Desulfitobacterium sp.]